jgi:hypothetical protein
MDEDTKRARGAPKGNTNRVTHGHYIRSRRRYGDVDGRTRTGKKAQAWRRWAIAQKGNGSCPYHVRQEIDLCAFDLWLLLELGAAIAEDAHRRGTVLNRRRKKLPDVHNQYNMVSMRFSGRVAALALEKGPLDLARRLTAEKAQADGGAK